MPSDPDMAGAINRTTNAILTPNKAKRHTITTLTCAGARAIIVINNVAEGGLLTMSGDGHGTQPAIPALLVSRHSGQLMLRALQHQTDPSTPLIATLVLQPPDKSRSKGSSKQGGGGDGAGAGAGSAGGGNQHQQRQRHQQQPKGHQQGHKQPSHGSEEPKPINGNTRVDLLIPMNTHAFIQAHVLAQGRELTSVFEHILQDGRAMLLMMQVGVQ